MSAPPRPMLLAAIERRDLEGVRRLRALGATPSLADSARILCLLRQQNPGVWERAAIRWLRCYLTEREAILKIDDVGRALDAIVRLDRDPRDETITQLVPW